MSFTLEQAIPVATGIGIHDIRRVRRPGVTFSVGISGHVAQNVGSATWRCKCLDTEVPVRSKRLKSWIGIGFAKRYPCATEYPRSIRVVASASVSNSSPFSSTSELPGRPNSRIGDRQNKRLPTGGTLRGAGSIAVSSNFREPKVRIRPDVFRLWQAPGHCCIKVAHQLMEVVS